MELWKIKEFLIEKNIYCTIEGQSDENTLPYLQIFLDHKEKGNYVFEIAYVPDIENEIETFKLLQIVVAIREFEINYPKEIDSLIHDINKAMAMPGFVSDPKNGFVYYRYVMPISKIEKNVDLNEFLEILDFLFFQILQQVDLIKSVANEEV